MDGIYEAMFSRNQDLISAKEQEKIRDCTVAIAGVGGIGGLLAERLIRIGVRHLKIADPGSFEMSNFNRQFGSHIRSLGKNKAKEVYWQCKQINPEADIICDTKGILSEKDAEAFVTDVDVIVDAMDYGLFKQAVYLQTAARRRGIYYMFSSAIGFGTVVVIFDPDGYTLEEYNDLGQNKNSNEKGQPDISQKNVVPYLASYIFEALGDEKLNKIIKREIPVPVNSIGVGLSSIVTANEVINIVIKKKPIITAPHYLFIDLLERKYEVMEKDKH